MWAQRDGPWGQGLEYRVLISGAGSPGGWLRRQTAQSDLELAVDSMQRHKGVGLLARRLTVCGVRATRRDAYTDPDTSVLVLHEYRLDLCVALATVVVPRSR